MIVVVLFWNVQNKFSTYLLQILFLSALLFVVLILAQRLDKCNTQNAHFFQENLCAYMTSRAFSRQTNMLLYKNILTNQTQSCIIYAGGFVFCRSLDLYFLFIGVIIYD